MCGPGRHFWTSSRLWGPSAVPQCLWVPKQCTNILATWMRNLPSPRLHWMLTWRFCPSFWPTPQSSLVPWSPLALNSPASQPGIYRRADGTQVDLLVPEIVSGRQGRRGADLGVHGIRAARQVRGLEGALVSQTTKPIVALGGGDEHSFDILVAGPAALLVAKVHKIADRS